MIIEREKCRTKFSLDESLLKETGSRVRCSLCKHVFFAFPTEAELRIEEIPIETVEKTKPGASEQRERPHDRPRSFSAISNANNKMLSLATNLESCSVLQDTFNATKAPARFQYYSPLPFCRS